MGLISRAVDLIYPPRCSLCGTLAGHGRGACAACDARLQRLAGDANIELPWRVWLGRARSCFAHEDPVRHALWSLKFEGALFSLGFFSDSMAREACRMGPHDLVVPVPMLASRLVARGVDAASLLARRVAKAAGWGVCLRALGRTGRVRRQVGLGREDRVANVRGAFEARPQALGRLRAARVLLVDDVMTTGSTLNECARALIAAGAERVDALTLARAL